MTRGNFLNGVDRFDTIASGFYLSGRDRESKAIDDDVAFAKAPARGDVRNKAFSDLDFLLRCACLSLFVNSESHDRRAMLLDQRHNPVIARPRAVTVLKIHRVDRAPATKVLKTHADNIRLRRVQHDRQRRVRRQTAREFGHVLGAVTADIVDAQINHVGAVASLGLSDIQALIPVALEHRRAESLGTVGVRPLPNHGDPRVLSQRHG